MTKPSLHAWPLKSKNCATSTPCTAHKFHRPTQNGTLRRAVFYTLKTVSFSFSACSATVRAVLRCRGRFAPPVKREAGVNPALPPQRSASVDTSLRHCESSWEGDVFCLASPDTGLKTSGIATTGCALCAHDGCGDSLCTGDAAGRRILLPPGRGKVGMGVERFTMNGTLLPPP